MRDDPAIDFGNRSCDREPVPTQYVNQIGLGRRLERGDVDVSDVSRVTCRFRADHQPGQRRSSGMTSPPGSFGSGARRSAGGLASTPASRRCSGVIGVGAPVSGS